MRLSSICEAEIGRRGLLRGMVGAAASPSTAARALLGAAVPALSGLAASIAAYRQSGLDDDVLDGFMDIMRHNIRPQVVLNARTAGEIAKLRPISYSGIRDKPYMAPGNPNPFRGITPDIVRGLLASHPGKYAIDLTEPAGKLEAFIGDVEDFLTQIPAQKVKEMAKEILRTHTSTYSDPDEPTNTFTPGGAADKLRKLMELSPQAFPFTKKEIENAFRDDKDELGLIKLAQKKGLLSQQEVSDTIKKYREGLESEGGMGRPLSDEERKKLEQEQEEQEREKQERKKQLAHEKSAPPHMPAGGRPFMLRHPEGPVPSRPTESFQRRLDEKLGETRSRARLFVNGKETNVPSEVPDDEWVEFSMALGKRVLGDDWENCAFVTLPDDPEHITELWLGDPPPHAEDIPEERVIRLARQSEEEG